jgi:hypothetical protein
MVSKVAAARNEVKGGVLGDRVNVTTEFLKFDAADIHLSYQLKGPFLALTESSRSKREERGLPTKRPDILALLPTVWTRVGAARKLIEHLLTGKPKAREVEWYRLRKEWEAAGLIEVKGNSIRSVAV